MAHLKSLALCLRVVDYGETSQIATFFTRERGKVGAIAKGAKRRTSRFVGVLEPLLLGEVVCVKGRSAESGSSLWTLTELDVRDTYRSLRRDLKALYRAGYVVELLREVLPEAEPEPALFDLAVDALARIAGDPLAVVRFEARALSLLGLFPEVERCVECKAPAIGSDGATLPLFGRSAAATAVAPAAAAAGTAMVAFAAAEGGVLCPACTAGRAAAGRGAPPMAVTPGSLRALAALARTGPETVPRVRVAPILALEIRALLDRYVASVLDRELRLAKYLR